MYSTAFPNFREVLETLFTGNGQSCDICMIVEFLLDAGNNGMLNVPRILVWCSILHLLSSSFGGVYNS